MEKYLLEDEVKRLLSNITDIMDSALIQTGLDLGCRVSEIVNIQTSNIDYQRQTIKIWDEKKDEWRTCVVTKSTLLEIQKYLNARDEKSPLLFDFSYKTANRHLKKWCKKTGIPKEKAHWHTLRHTHIVQSRLKGRDIKAVQQQTGDSLYTLLRIYSNLAVEDRVKIYEEKPILPEIKGNGEL